MAEVGHVTQGAVGRAELSSNGNWPRITLVTPVWNSAKYVEQTLKSVLGQEYPNLEYFVVDGGSTDGTVEIIRKYEDRLSGWISEPDRGMYDALNKGFAKATGEVMGWISATDLLHVGGLHVVGSVFRALPEVEWITGRPTRFDEEGMTIDVGEIPHWSQKRFLAGVNRYIQQESTFWRKSLWEKAGSRVDDSRRSASDFELWVKFFRYAPLYPVDALIGGFRMHGDSLGLVELDACHSIHEEIVEAELGRAPWGQRIQFYRRLNGMMRKIPVVRYAWWRTVEQMVARMPAGDWVPTIRYELGKGWRM